MVQKPEEDEQVADPGPPKGKRQFPCGKCGAKLDYAPGTTVLKCPYCSAETPIPQSPEQVVELDFNAALMKLEENEPTEERQVVACDACGAQTTLPPNTIAGQCSFCGVNIVATFKSAKAIKPHALLPFAIRQPQAVEAFEKWLASLWFAPFDLKQMSQRSGKLAGVYVPYWTYDADTTSAYTGERGINYTVTVGSGNNRRTETRTRWYPVSGVIYGEFDDVLVVATRSLPIDRLKDLEPWDLQKVVPYSDEFLSGFQAQSYQITLREGFQSAKEEMDEQIRGAIRRDIGGDHQRIHSVRTRYDAITFKHLLLPVWVAAYIYHGKTYRFFVNARTGEVQGDRPYSVFKITFAVLMIVLAALAIYYFFNHGGRVGG